jgi:hypothetical protein
LDRGVGVIWDGGLVDIIIRKASRLVDRDVESSDIECHVESPRLLVVRASEQPYLVEKRCGTAAPRVPPPRIRESHMCMTARGRMPFARACHRN